MKEWTEAQRSAQEAGDVPASTRKGFQFGCEACTYQRVYSTLWEADRSLRNHVCQKPGPRWVTDTRTGNVKIYVGG